MAEPSESGYKALAEQFASDLRKIGEGVSMMAEGWPDLVEDVAELKTDVAEVKNDVKMIKEGHGARIKRLEDRVES